MTHLITIIHEFHDYPKLISNAKIITGAFLGQLFTCANTKILFPAGMEQDSLDFLFLFLL
jgi:hypothetical protein